MERGGWKPNVDIYPPCPRCGSSNTKFCYYNNYSLTQPRYFCKGCQRYWTKGGSLRCVPVGGGCRKSRRSSKSSIRICSRNSPYGGNSNTIDVTSTSTVPNATNNIDLAQVYANFLNQRPHDQPSQDHQIPQLPTGLDSSGPIMDVDFGTRLFQENGIIFECEPFCDRSSETYLSYEGNGEYLCGFDSRVHEGILNESTNQMVSYYALPPLPGEELAWSSSLGFQEEGQNPEFDLPDNGTYFKP